MSKNKELILNLQERAKLIKFEEKEHKYLYKGKEFISATTLIGIMRPDKGFQEFMKDPDKRKMVERKAELGTRVHFAIENFYNEGEMNYELLQNNIREKKYITNFLNFDKNHSWRKDVNILSSETIVYNEEISVAGTIDLLYETKEGKIGILDFKTTSSLRETYKAQSLIYALLLKHSLKLNYLPEAKILYLGLYQKANYPPIASNSLLIDTNYEEPFVKLFYKDFQDYTRKNR